MFPIKSFADPDFHTFGFGVFDQQPTQAVVCKIAQGPPINWNTAIRPRKAANLDFIRL